MNSSFITTRPGPGVCICVGAHTYTMTIGYCLWFVGVGQGTLIMVPALEATNSFKV